MKEVKLTLSHLRKLIREELSKNKKMLKENVKSQDDAIRWLISEEMQKMEETKNKKEMMTEDDGKECSSVTFKPSGSVYKIQGYDKDQVTIKNSTSSRAILSNRVSVKGDAGDKTVQTIKCALMPKVTPEGMMAPKMQVSAIITKTARYGVSDIKQRLDLVLPNGVEVKFM